MDFSLLVEKLNLQIKSYQVINLHFDTPSSSIGEVLLRTYIQSKIQRKERQRNHLRDKAGI